MSIDIEGDVAIQFRIRLPIAEAHRLLRLVEDLGTLAAADGATVERIDTPLQLEQPSTDNIAKPKTKGGRRLCRECKSGGRHTATCSKKSKTTDPPGASRTCRTCHQPGHYAKNCTATGHHAAPMPRQSPKPTSTRGAAPVPDPGHPTGTTTADHARDDAAATEELARHARGLVSVATCVHHYFMAPLDGSDTVTGRCKLCGDTKEFDPHPTRRGPQPPHMQPEPHIAGDNPVAVKRSVATGSAQTCKACGHHPRSQAHADACNGGIRAKGGPTGVR